MLVDLRQLFDQIRIFTVVRTAMESQRRRFAFRIDTAGQIAREQHGADAGNVGLIAEHQQVEHDLDVLIE